MASDAKIRASDADRDRIAAALREHLAAGRLTIEEFDERLDKAYAAKTLGELDKVMADLPGTGLSQLPDAPADRSAASPPLTRRRPPGSIQAGTGQVLPGVAGSLGVLARVQPVLLRDLAGQRRQRRPVVLVGGAAARRRAAGPLDDRRARAQGTQASPAAEEPQVFRRPGQAVTSRST